MHNEPFRPNGPFSTPANQAPDPLPPTLQRVRPTSPNMSLSDLGNLPIEVETITGGVVPDEVQPSAQMRALRGGGLASATAIITGAFIVSRLLGLLRITLFSSTFGATSISDAYNFAFNLPDTVYNIIAGGALSSAFIPVFTDYLIERRDRATAWYVTSLAFNIFSVLLIALAVLAAIFARPLAHLYAPGIFADPSPAAQQEADLIVTLSRIMLIQPIVLGVSVITTGVLQARHLFLLPAIGSALYNVGLIAGIVATQLDNRYGIFGGHLGILGPTYGVVVAAALQFLVQIPGLFRAKMHYTLSFNILHPGIRRVFALMGPRFINSIVLYIANFVVLALLSYQDSGSVYGYRQAFTIMLLPTGIFGIAVSQAAFPTLATLVSSRNWERMQQTVLSTLRVIIYLAVPSSLGMMVLAEPITKLLVVHGAFDPAKASFVYIPLIFFAIGIPGLSLVEILVRAYYALQDVRTTVEISVMQFLFVIGLSIVLINETPLGPGALALATSLGATGEAVVLLLLLRPRMGRFRLRPLFNFVVGVLAASLVATLAALLAYTLLVVLSTYLLIGVYSSLINTAVLAGQLIVAAVVGAVVYYLGARFLGIESTFPIDRLVMRVAGRFRRR